MNDVRFPSLPLSTVCRGHRLLHPALRVQEEECEAHRRRGVAGGPARYEPLRSCLRVRAERRLWIETF